MQDRNSFCLRIALLLACLIVALGETEAQVIERNTTSCSSWAFWASWSEISECTTTCSSGVQMRRRERQCNTRTRVKQVDLQTFACGSKFVPDSVTQWTEWTQGSKCAAYCGRGLKRSVRTHECISACGGSACNEDLRDEKYLPCVNIPCEGICFNFQQPVSVSPYSPSPGYFIQCLKESGFLRRCPPITAFPAASARMFGAQEIFDVCYGNSAASVNLAFFS